ncbi:hypothetical protein BCR33DRAFT_720595 [Rhizoclosmatium globosum]|uniref:Uncharacterized protein n=1 Tax=Rhizoclosmatium globosum TaxID=329046 RepID=A0A1Y2BUW9_9FUNG|nr:hypothetical protein BCR33DRAFT_720595 [Rhizoclosmatium globosum]|eukprot:ORY38549.1 hypothetical protein BCR33DRAFT_720595 [Rhizoclosmatium globosum]
MNLGNITVPTEILEQAFSWIEPQLATAPLTFFGRKHRSVLYYRRLCKLFDSILTSTHFAQLNLGRFLPRSILRTDSTKWFRWPSSYRQVYCSKHLKITVVGQIPAQIMLFQNLVQLRLTNGSLVGIIPPELGRIRR